MAFCRRFYEYPCNCGIFPDSFYSERYHYHSTGSTDRCSDQKRNQQCGKSLRSMASDWIKQDAAPIIIQNWMWQHFSAGNAESIMPAMSHDEMEDHSFEATSEAEPWPVLCGCCRNKLSREEYKTGSCPYCHAQFNPGCSLHENIYFCK